MTNYIGRDLDKISNIEILDNITFDGSQSYTLQKGGVNFTPNSAQSIILGIDGITQIGNFSVNGSTIDFGVAVANTSTCNYIIHLGTGLLTAPSDGSVTNAKLGTAPTLEAKGSGGTAGGVKYFCEAGTHGVTIRSPAHANYSGSYELKLPTAQGGADTFLKNDGSGNLSFATAGGGITEADQFRLTSNFSTSGADITSNLERNDSLFSYIGNGMTESSGVFTFPQTGIYLIDFNVAASTTSTADINYVGGRILGTTNNSSFSDLAEQFNSRTTHSSTYYFSANMKIFFDVTNVSTHKVKFYVLSSAAVNFQGATTENRTHMTFIRLGAT